MYRQPHRGLGASSSGGFKFNPRSQAGQNPPQRAASRDSGLGTSTSAGSSRQNQPASAVSNQENFDWGDDDDEMLMVMASQQAEAEFRQQQQQQQAGGQAHPRRLQSSPTSRDAMNLEDIRFELALKEKNGEDVRMDDFMQDGVLGRDLSKVQQRSELDQKRIAELEKINKELKTQNYQCKGEVTNLRRLLEKQRQERSQDLVARMARDEEAKKKEVESRKKASEELEKLNTELKYTRNQLRSASEKNEAYKKQLQKFHTLSQSQAGPNQSQLNTSVSFLDTTRPLPPTKSLASIGFPTRSSFSRSEVISPAASAAAAPVTSPPVLPISPKKTVITSTAEAQTDPKLSESPAEAAEKKWKEEQAMQKETLQAQIELISVMATKEFTVALPKLQKITASAEAELVENLNLKGYPYELFFPGNLKIAEFKIDQDKRKLKGEDKNKATPKFPSQLEDWPGLHTFDGTIHQLLFAEQDVWGAMCFVLKDLMERINYMRRKKRNSLYRPNNAVHFFKLLSWSASLWSNFEEKFWYSRSPENMQAGILEEIRQWSAVMFWIGNQYFKVLDFQVRVRPLVLRTLTHMMLNCGCHCAYSNYVRVYYLIYHTLTIARHFNASNYILCLQLAQAMDRKKFVLDFICRGKNDQSCLAYQFAKKGYQLFVKEKKPEPRFRLYENYLKLLVTIREWCCVHLNGEGEHCNEPDQVEDDEGDPIFVVPKKTPISEDFNSAGPAPSHLRGGHVFEKTINSFYLSEEIEVDDEDEDGATQPMNRLEPARKKQRLDDDLLQHLHGVGGSSAATAGSTQTAGTNVEEDGSEVSEDEWDELQSQAKQILRNSQPRDTAGPDTPCRKFLDCSLWEEQRTGVKVGHCQCRFYLLETFMRMTEEVIHIWRHVKTNYEFQRLKDDMNQYGPYEEDLKDLIRSLEEEKRRNGEVKTPEQLAKDYEMSPENPFWKRIILDSKKATPRLTPHVVAGALESAVEIIYDAYLTTQHSTRGAFGSEGTNSLNAIIAYLLTFSKALNFSEEMRILIYRIAEDTLPSSKEASSSQRWARQPDAALLEGIPSGYEDFDAPIEPNPSLDFDLADPSIREMLPPSLIESIEAFEARKQEALEKFTSSNNDDDGSDEAMEVDEPGPSKGRPKAGRPSLNTSSDLFPTSQADPSGKKEAQGKIPEAESGPEDEDDDAEDGEDSGWETIGSDEDESEGIETKVTQVKDYKKFCGPALEEQAEFVTPVGAAPVVTYEQLLETLRQGPGIDCSNLVKFKSAKEACDELKRSSGSASTAQSGPAKSTIECSKEVDDLLQKLMSNMKVKGYYKDRNPLWDDYKDRSLPF